MGDVVLQSSCEQGFLGKWQILYQAIDGSRGSMTNTGSVIS